MLFPIDHPLLGDGKKIIDRPVEDESGGESVDDWKEDVRHVLHHLDLGIVDRRRWHHTHLNDHGGEVEEG